MQTTLLSIAIALILALLAALVGPHFIDWNNYRATFEGRASQITGLDVRIGGPIEARLLPTPSVTLRRIDIARPGEAGTLQARRLNIEFALGSLVRGEWKATDVHVDGAELSLGIDGNGRPEWPAPSGGFDPNSISIEQLDVRDSRVLLTDSASGSSAVLDKFEFKGELRTLAGPLKGQGSFYLDGQHYPYRVAASRTADSALRVRVNVDPIDLPLTADADAVLTIEDGIPRLEGTLQFARPVGRAPENAAKEIIEPWRLGGRIKGDSRSATIEQVEFQYGSDERPIKLRGNAKLTFGRSPLLHAVLSSPQVDLDRILALPAAERNKPAAAIKAFADQFASRYRLPVPIDLGISIDSLTLAGGTLQRVAADIKSAAEGWNLQTLEFRAPGLTQAQFSGRLGIGGERLSFVGRTRIESKDPRALLTWLTDPASAQAIASSSLFIDGTVRLGNDAIAVDRLSAEVDRMKLEGSVAYHWGTSERPARIEASLRAPDIDIDRTYGLMQGLLAGTAFDLPREGELKAQIGRAAFAGVDARRTDISMRFNAHGIEIERLAIGDLGGAMLAAKGRIDTRAQAPTGALTFDLDAKRLEGVITLLEKLSPAAAGELRRNAKRFAPAKLTASLTVAPPANADDPQVAGTFKMNGAAGLFQINLGGDFGAGRDDLTLANLQRMKAVKLGRLEGRIEANDGATLVGLLGLERLVSVTRGRGRMDVTAKGSLDGEMAVVGQVLAGGLDVSAQGTLRLAGSQGPTAGLDLKIANANLLAPPQPGRPAQTLPLAVTTRLALAEGVVRLTDLNGKIADTDVSGRLRIGFGQPLNLGGDLRLGSASLPAAVAAAIGLPQGSGGAWSTEPFERGLIGSLEGQVTVRLGAVTLSPTLRGRDLRAVLRFEPEQLSLEDIDGTFADGRVAGGLVFQRNADGVAAQGHLRFAGADVGELLQGGLAGRMTLDVDVEGAGRSPTALIGALKGSGTFTFQDGRISGLDPSAFQAVMRAVEQGLSIDAARVGDRMDAALNGGVLPVGLAQGELSLAAGTLRLTNTVVRAKGADVLVSASLGLADNVVDARLTLTGPAQDNVLKGARPEIGISIRGPITSPKRSLDVTRFSNWLAMRAIEEKTKRIDALESGKELPVPPPAAAPPVTPSEAAPVMPVPQSAPPSETVPAPVAPRAAAPPAAPHKKAPAAQPGQPAPKVAPPVDIRPGAAARAQQPPSNPGTTKQAPKPASRSWLESLFGP